MLIGKEVLQDDHLHEERTLVDFDGKNDPSDPLNWSLKYKWNIVILLSATTAVV